MSSSVEIHLILRLYWKASGVLELDQKRCGTESGRGEWERERVYLIRISISLYPQIRHALSIFFLCITSEKHHSRVLYSEKLNLTPIHTHIYVVMDFQNCIALWKKIEVDFFRETNMVYYGFE